MPSLWNSLFVVWLAWCTVAYGSARIHAPLATRLASPLAAVLAAMLGVWLVWQAWRKLRAVNGPRAWLRPQEWSVSSWAGVGAAGVYIAIDGISVFAGRISSVFGIYIVGALVTLFVSRVTRATPSVVLPPG
jgi:hypothetical protein